MKWKFFCLFPILCLVSCVNHIGSSHQNNTEKAVDSEPTAEEYEIYSTLILDKYKTREHPLVVVRDHTWKGWWIEPWDYPGRWEQNRFKRRMDKQAFLDVQAKDRDSYSLSDRFDPAIGVRMFGEKESGEIKSKATEAGTDWWEAFGKLYPNARGFLLFSRVGFDSQQTRALVFVAHYFGNVGLEAEFVLLRKVAGHWKIVTRMPRGLA